MKTKIRGCVCRIIAAGKIPADWDVQSQTQNILFFSLLVFLSISTPLIFLLFFFHIARKFGRINFVRLSASVIKAVLRWCPWLWTLTLTSVFGGLICRQVMSLPSLFLSGYTVLMMRQLGQRCRCFSCDDSHEWTIRKWMFSWPCEVESKWVKSAGFLEDRSLNSPCSFFMYVRQILYTNTFADPSSKLSFGFIKIN